MREEYAERLGRLSDVSRATRTYRELLADLERLLSPNHRMTQRVAQALADAELRS